MHICDGSLHLILWFCWALSLFQFAFSFAPYAKTRELSPSLDSYLHYQTKRVRLLFIPVNCSVKSNPKSNKIQQYFHQPEVWAILILFGFQEVPFLLSRIYFITILKMVKSQMMVFFIAKNVLTIIVFGYRKNYELISIY